MFDFTCSPLTNLLCCESVCESPYDPITLLESGTLQSPHKQPTTTHHNATLITVRAHRVDNGQVWPARRLLRRQ